MFLHVSVIHSVHRGGVSQTPPGHTCPPSQTPPPWADTPRADTPRADTPIWQTPPLDRHPLGLRTPPWTKYTPQDTVNARAVSILLECKLVQICVQEKITKRADLAES